MLTKLVWSRDENNYYYDIFLENASNELPEKTFYVKYKCYIRTKFKFWKELILTKQMAQKRI